MICMFVFTSCSIINDCGVYVKKFVQRKLTNCKNMSLHDHSILIDLFITHSGEQVSHHRIFKIYLTFRPPPKAHSFSLNYFFVYAH